MSKHQTEGVIETITNMLFGQEWKPYNKHETPYLDTLPSMRNVLQFEQIELFLEAMALNAIVEEIMIDDTTATVYTNNGSSQSGVGSCVVQSLTTNGQQRTFSKFGIFTESRKSLAELEAITLKILSAASFHRYSEMDILNRIDFVMMDST